GVHGSGADSGRAQGGGVEISVTDTGRGMDEATRQRVFEPFFTTKGHGTGLGLSITQEIVEAHGGVIHCERVEPRGTRFVIVLPTGQPSSAASAPRIASTVQPEA